MEQAYCGKTELQATTEKLNLSITNDDQMNKQWRNIDDTTNNILISISTSAFVSK